MSRRLAVPLISLCLALVLTACGGDGDEDGGGDLETGSGVLELSNGTTYDLTLDSGGCTTADPSSVSFSAGGDGVTVTADAVQGTGFLLMSGDFEAEGRVDSASVGDGVATLTGVVTEADDTASPNDFTLMVRCA